MEVLANIREMRRSRDLELGCVGVVGEGGAVEVCLDDLVDGKDQRREVRGLRGRGGLNKTIGC